MCYADFSTERYGPTPELENFDMGQSEETRVVVDRLLRAIAAGEPTQIAGVYAEHVSWQLAWPEDEYDGAVPWIRHRSTRADVEDHYRTVAEFTVPEESDAEITAVLVDGPDAAVVGSLGQKLRATGVSYRVPFILNLTVSDGLITKHNIVEDNLTIKRAFESVG